jgi:hypothetical protein
MKKLRICFSRMRIAVGAALLTGLVLLAGAVVLAQEATQATGRITYLQVQSIGDSGDLTTMAIVIQLAGQGDRQFGFQLDAPNPAAQQAMFDLLRDAYFNNQVVSIEYTLGPGQAIGVIRRVWVSQPEQPVGELPASVPEVAALEFAIPDERFAGDAIFPPQIVGATNVEILPVEGVSIGLTPEEETEVLELALANAEVRGLLGERFNLLTAERIPVDIALGKDVAPELADRLLSLERPITLATFFSYDNNLVVEVFLQEREVIFINRRNPREYQPPESPEEVEQAVALAREALGRRVAELTGTAILAFPVSATGEPTFYDRRVLYVAFYERLDAAPLFYALVDLTNQEVLEAGPTG